MSTLSILEIVQNGNLQRCLGGDWPLRPICCAVHSQTVQNISNLSDCEVPCHGRKEVHWTRVQCGHVWRDGGWNHGHIFSFYQTYDLISTVRNCTVLVCLSVATKLPCSHSLIRNSNSLERAALEMAESHFF